ncbi:MAG: glycosyltransferase family 2 protein [Segatella copri]
MATKISVIIPTYAPKDYLWECLGSLENQTLSKDEFEVILVLNGEREPYESLIRKKLPEYSFTAHCFTQHLMECLELEILEWIKHKVAISVSLMMTTGYQTTI